MLIAFGNMIGRKAYYALGNTKHYTSLNGLLIGGTGDSRKGTAYQEAVAPFREIDPVWTSGCIASGLSSGEGLVHRLRDANVTKKDPGVIDKRALVFESEFCSVLKMFERKGNTLSPILRNAWDNHAPLEYMVKREPERATDTHVSIIGHITPEELMDNINATEVANGLVNRFLLIHSSRTQLLAFGGRAIPKELEEFQRACRAAERLLNQRVSKGDGKMVFSPDAKKAYERLYGQGETRGVLNQTKPGLFGQLIARAAPQLLRLSLIYAVLDCSAKIELPHLAAALAVVDYSVRSTYMIFGSRLGVVAADAILDGLRSRPNGMTRTEISSLFSHNLLQDQIETALARLSKEGLASSEVEPSKDQKGRPAEVWKATDEPLREPTPDYLSLFKKKEWKAKLERAARELRQKQRDTTAKLGDAERVNYK
jgi:hypothetical protein